MVKKILQFKGNCPYFKYGKEYYIHDFFSIKLVDYVLISKYCNINIILPKNENTDYLEHIIKKHFEKVNLRNKVNRRLFKSGLIF